MKQAADSSACSLLHAGFLLDLPFNPEDGGDIFIRKVGELLSDYTTFHTRRQTCSPVGILN
jgi:hypothetical protein